MKKEIIDFLEHNNLIEGVGEEGLTDSIKAYDYLMQVKPPLTEKHLLKTHKLLLRNLNPRIAGNYRDCLVQVGGRICPPVQEIPKRLKEFFELINRKCPKYSKCEKENFCKLTHIIFEKAHPFEDGNGRTGRLLLNWQRKQMSLPILIVRYENRWEYYNWFI